jgi:hypothetical protein
LEQGAHLMTSHVHSFRKGFRVARENPFLHHKTLPVEVGSRPPDEVPPRPRDQIGEHRASRLTPTPFSRNAYKCHHRYWHLPY